MVEGREFQTLELQYEYNTATVRQKLLFQVENGVGGETHHDGADDAEMLDGRVGTEDDNEDDVSEISGLSDVSITGAGRWHPMKGLFRGIAGKFCIWGPISRPSS